jgi:hypothetical protein
MLQNILGLTVLDIHTQFYSDGLDGPTKSKAFIDELEEFGFEVDVSDTIFQFVKDIYTDLPIENMEY